MVIDHVRAERAQQTVIPLRAGALERRVLLPAGAHAIDDVIPVQKGREHGIDGIDIVLQVGVHGDDAVGAIAQRHQSAQQRVLVAAVAREPDAGKDRVLRVQVGDDRHVSSLEPSSIMQMRLSGPIVPAARRLANFSRRRRAVSGSTAASL